MNTLIQTGLIVISLILAINMIILNLVVVNKKTAANLVIASETTTQESADQYCDQVCQDSIMATLLQRLPTPDTKIIETVLQPIRGSSEIYLGQAEINSQTWIAVPGTKVTIDTNMTGTSQALVTYTVSIPTANGTVEAKLVNLTDQHDVWNSQVTGETDRVSILEKTITLSPGSNQYQLYMRTSMPYQAILHSARIRFLSS